MLSLMTTALGQILLFGLVLGAGLPVLFALGIRSLAWGAGGDAEIPAGGPRGAVAAPPRPLGKVLAVVCFAIVLACVALGITFIVASGFGKVLSFSHVFPTLVDKA